jgi:hypothetical protein
MRVPPWRGDSLTAQRTATANTTATANSSQKIALTET